MRTMEQNGEIAISKRRAWRDLRGYAAPTGWMSDDELERLTPRMVSVKQITQAVRLANAAPDLLNALSELLKQAVGPAAVYGDGRGNDGKKTGLSHWEFNALRDERIAQARAAIAKATGQLTPAQREQGATLAQEMGA